MPSVLQLLAQRPTLTGSGVTIDALAREASRRGWEQHAVVAHPHGEAPPTVDGLPDERIHPLEFGTADLPFPVPGMSDVMPYPSTVFSSMGAADWERYVAAWRAHLARVVDRVRPDLIHAHHVWLLSSLVKEIAPEIPQVIHCHATGLRQMRLDPERARPIAAGCRRAEAFVALHDDHREELAARLGIPIEKVHVVGAGYAAELFHARGRDPDPGSILFAGKLARSKGLAVLLEAFERLAERHPGICLHVAGEGSGDEGRELRDRVLAMAPRVVFHGRIDQPALARLMRRRAVFALPSFYEGLPLALVEARASGCRVVATALSGTLELARAVDGGLDLVEPPRMATVDRPELEDLPRFTDRLERALERALGMPGSIPEPRDLEPFTWAAVFARIERVWRLLLGGRG
jgi:glycosyltransferase involved in cell wall biosynthesis